VNRSAALGSAIVATLIAGVVTVPLHAGRHQAASVGRLASLLAHHHADAVTAAVVPESRSTLSAKRLQSDWDAITQVAGPLRGVAKTVVVGESGGAADEIELVRFGNGQVGIVAAHRVGKSISGLVMLAGTADRAAEAAGAHCALDLVSGRITDVVAKFAPQMSALLSLNTLTIETAEATGGLHPPAHVAAQVVARQGTYTVVETYLVFTNGIRRIETTFAPDGKIAGLYIRRL